MFLKVKIKDHSIIINLGTDLSQASNLVEMFEKNAVVVEESYSGVRLITDVKSTIELGEELTFEKSGYSGEESNITVTVEEGIVGCVNVNANAFVDLDAVNKKHVAHVKRLSDEIALLRATNKALESRIEELESSEEVE